MGNSKKDGYKISRRTLIIVLTLLFVSIGGLLYPAVVIWVNPNIYTEDVSIRIQTQVDSSMIIKFPLIMMNNTESFGLSQLETIQKNLNDKSSVVLTIETINGSKYFVLSLFGKDILLSSHVSTAPGLFKSFNKALSNHYFTVQYEINSSYINVPFFLNVSRSNTIQPAQPVNFSLTMDYFTQQCSMSPRNQTISLDLQYGWSNYTIRNIFSPTVCRY